MTEYTIWGNPPDLSGDTILYTKATSKIDAERVVKYLETVKGCTNCRIQTICLDTPGDVIKSFINAVNI